MELISREEAKRKITEELDSIDHVPSWVFIGLEEAISSLPTVEERKEGYWIFKPFDDGNDGGRYVCSECGYENYFSDSYCGGCGAKMKGEAND